MSRPTSARGAGLSILLGYFSIALAFGVAARAFGLAVSAAGAMSVFVFAGASQFVAVGLLAQGTPIAAIVAATFVLNSRHIVMSMALRDRITGSRISRFILGFGITDEVFAATATRRGPVPDRELLTIEAMAYSGWVSGTIVGYLAGGVLPDVVQDSMGIALYAMFVALLVPAVRRFPRYVVPAAVAGALNWLLQWLGLAPGAALLISIATTAAVFAIPSGWTEES